MKSKSWRGHCPVALANKTLPSKSGGRPTPKHPPPPSGPALRCACVRTVRELLALNRWPERA